MDVDREVVADNFGVALASALMIGSLADAGTLLIVSRTQAGRRRMMASLGMPLSQASLISRYHNLQIF